MAPRFKSRSDAFAFIAHEGGIQAALEFGITEADMPEDDAELISAWHFLRISWELADQNSNYVERILRTRKGDIVPPRPTRIVPATH